MFPEPHFVETNSLRMAVYEQGTGPAVICLHGFPEVAYSWRYQLPALAGAGFRAIAPDLRGYGRTTAPADVADYGISELIADVHGLLDALDLETAVFLGHDWGALLLWQMGMLAPERVERQVVFNVPHLPRPLVDPIDLMRRRFGDDFYIVNFQDSDEADRLLESDPRRFIDRMMRRNQIRREDYEKLPPERQAFSLIRAMRRASASGEPLLSEAELDYFAEQFARSGFSGPINWYRNWTNNWRLLDGVDQQIDIPTLFIGGTHDIVIALQQIEAMKPLVNDLTVRMLDCGHWTQQEQPDEVNRLVLEWLLD
jgi:pimeloyl-ACP methyl ester carboxylesterase